MFSVAAAPSAKLAVAVESQKAPLDAIKSQAEAALNSAVAVYGKLKEQIKSSTANAPSLGETKDWAIDAIGSVQKKVNQAVDKLKQGNTLIAQGIQDIEEAAEKASTTVQSEIGTAVEKLKKLGSNIPNLEDIEKAARNAKETAEQAINQAVSIARTNLLSIRKKITELAGLKLYTDAV